MMTLIPPYCGDEVKSNAERKIFERLKEIHRDGYVLHSLGLPKHQSKVYGEIDFVVICERGIACLEIKGGRIECRSGQWYFIDRYGTEHKKTEGPFAQAVGNMFSLKKVMAQQLEKKVWMKDTLFASGVMFPDMRFQAQGQEMIPEIVFDKTTEQMENYLDRVFDYWEGRWKGSPRPLSPQNQKDVAEFLRGDFTYVPSLGERLDEVDQRLLRLTREQALLLDSLSMNDHLMIEGGAGTGKTMLAMEYARRECDRERKVLYLTYNKNLARDIINRIETLCGGNIKIINLHALFGEYVQVDLEAMRQDPNQYFTQDLPEDALSYLEGLPENELQALQYDDLILDEGQDILKPEYLLVMDLLLRGGLEHGRWAVFYDEKQNLYNPEFDEGFQFLCSYPNTRFKLYINCRNTAQIGTFNAKMSHTELEEYLKENGEEVQVISFKNDQDFQNQVLGLLEGLQADEVALEDVVFLSPKRLKNSRLSQADLGKFKINELGDGYQKKKDEPVYSTIQGFKGLDSKVVVLLDLDKIPAALYSKFVYTGCSRARSLLMVMKNDS